MDVHQNVTVTRDERGRTVTVHALPDTETVVRARAERTARLAVMADPFARMPVADDDQDGAW